MTDPPWPDRRERFDTALSEAHKSLKIPLPASVARKPLRLLRPVTWSRPMWAQTRLAQVLEAQEAFRDLVGRRLAYPAKLKAAQALSREIRREEEEARDLLIKAARRLRFRIFWARYGALVVTVLLASVLAIVVWLSRDWLIEMLKGILDTLRNLQPQPSPPLPQGGSGASGVVPAPTVSGAPP